MNWVQYTTADGYDYLDGKCSNKNILTSCVSILFPFLFWIINTICITLIKDDQKYIHQWNGYYGLIIKCRKQNKNNFFDSDQQPGVMRGPKLLPDVRDEFSDSTSYFSSASLSDTSSVSSVSEVVCFFRWTQLQVMIRNIENKSVKQLIISATIIHCLHQQKIERSSKK